MIRAPNMLILGSGGRNVGKTEFACSLIRQLSGRHSVVAVKVTTIRNSSGPCPRGGKGCGVCGSLTGKYMISEEIRSGEHKDTDRMKKAGAMRVYWVRTRSEHLNEAMEAFMRNISSAECVICESNSARLVVEPGAFIIIREQRTDSVKESCMQVRHLADREVVFNGSAWDLPPERCIYTGNRWIVPYKASAAILAGGRSRRMGADKAMLPIGKAPMIRHITNCLLPYVDELVIGTNDTAKFRFLNLPIVNDAQPDMGPLMGILSCLKATAHDKLLVAACDMPLIPVEIIPAMMRLANNAHAVVPRRSDGSIEPLFAVYTRLFSVAAEAALSAGKRRVRDALEESGINVSFLPVSSDCPIENVNTPEDYRRIISHAAI